MKAYPLIVVTPSGIVMAASEEHLWKAPQPIFITESGMVMAVREEQSLKASSPIVVTESGMVMAVREEHPSKVSSAIDVTPCAKVTSVSSVSCLKLPVPEYTAVWGILGKGRVLGLRRSFQPVFSLTV